MPERELPLCSKSGSRYSRVAEPPSLTRERQRRYVLAMLERPPKLPLPVEELPESVTKKLEVHFVSTFDEVIDLCL